MGERKVDIVILDDDEDLLFSVADLLADSGYTVKGFSDPESAVEFAVDQQFSLGIFDYRLGAVKNGLDVVETLKAMGSKAEFVMVTADVEKSTQTRATGLKVFQYMRKPVKPQELLTTIENALASVSGRAA